MAAVWGVWPWPRAAIRQKFGRDSRFLVDNSTKTTTNVFMTRIPAIILACSLPGCGAADAKRVVEAGESDRSSVFPTYISHDLNGRKVAVPGDAHSELTLIVVAFQRRQQLDVDGWLERAKPIFASHPGLDYLELPVLRRFNRVSRWFIDNGMRRGIPDEGKRARVITLYLDKEEFRRLTDIEREDDIHLFLVRRSSGEVLWRGHGPVTASAIDDLASAVAAESPTAKQAAL